MADEDVILQQVRLEGDQEAASRLQQLGAAGEQAFNRLSQAGSQKLQQINASLDNLGKAVSNLANTQVRIDTSGTTQAIDRLNTSVTTLSNNFDKFADNASQAFAKVSSQASSASREISQVGSSSKTALDQTSRSAQEASSSFDLVESAVSRFKGTILAFVTLGSAVAFVKEFSDALLKLSDIEFDAKKLNLPVDQYQQLLFIFQELGVSSEKVQEQIAKIGKDNPLKDFSNTIKLDIENVADLTNSLTKMGAAPKAIGEAFSGLAERLSSSLQKISQEGRQQADQYAANLDRIGVARHNLETAEQRASEVNKHSAQEDIRNIQSVRGAEISLAEARNKLAEIRGEGPVVDPQAIAREKAVLDVQEARARLAEARQRQEDAIAERRRKQEEADYARQRAALELQQAQKKADDERANSIQNLQKYATSLADQGRTGVSVVGGAGINATPENISKGIIASLGTASGAVRGFTGDLEDLDKQEPQVVAGVLKLADVLKGISDAGLRASVVTEFFGKSIGKDQVDYLSKGSQALIESRAKADEYRTAQADLLKSLSPGTLKAYVDQLSKIPDEQERLKKATETLGETIAEKLIKQMREGGTTIDGLRDRFNDLGLGAKSNNIEVANQYAKSIHNLQQAFVELGASGKASEVGIGTIFAPALIPVIDGISNSIRNINKAMKDWGKDIGTDFGKSIEDFFKLISGQGDQIDNKGGGFFTSLIQGVKTLSDAMAPVLKEINDFFGTKLNFTDVGLGVLLTSLIGGFNTLALAIVALVGKGGPALESVQTFLKDIGLDVDTIIAKVKNFGEEFVRAFKGPGEQRKGVGSDFVANEQSKQIAEQSKPASPIVQGFVDDVKGIPGILATVGVAAFALRRELAALFAVEVVDKYTGVLATLRHVIETVGVAILVPLEGIILAVRFLSVVNPFVALLTSLILVSTYSKTAQAALEAVAFTLNGFAEAINNLVGIKILPEDFVTSAGLFKTIIIGLIAALATLSTIRFVGLIAAFGEVTGIASLANLTVLGLFTTIAAGVTRAAPALLVIYGIYEAIAKVVEGLRKPISVPASKEQLQSQLQKLNQDRAAALTQTQSPFLPDDAKKLAADRLKSLDEQIDKLKNDINSIQETSEKTAEDIKDKQGSAATSIADSFKKARDEIADIFNGIAKESSGASQKVKQDWAKLNPYFKENKASVDVGDLKTSLDVPGPQKFFDEQPRPLVPFVKDVSESFENSIKEFEKILNTFSKNADFVKDMPHAQTPIEDRRNEHPGFEKVERGSLDEFIKYHTEDTLGIGPKADPTSKLAKDAGIDDLTRQLNVLEEAARARMEKYNPSEDSLRGTEGFVSVQTDDIKKPVKVEVVTTDSAVPKGTLARPSDPREGGPTVITDTLTGKPISSIDSQGHERALFEARNKLMQQGKYFDPNIDQLTGKSRYLEGGGYTDSSDLRLKRLDLMRQGKDFDPNTNQLTGKPVYSYDPNTPENFAKRQKTIEGDGAGGASDPVEQLATAATDASTNINQLGSAFEGISTGVDAVVQAMNQAAQAISDAVSKMNQTDTGGSEDSGLAEGGLISGPGSGTSDSIAARVSHGEYVQPAKATAHYGVRFMNAVRTMSLPRFEMGGLVSTLSAPITHSMPRFADGGLVSTGKSGATRSLSLTIGRETFHDLIAPEHVAQKMERSSTFQQMAATGRSPSWKR